MALGCLPPQFSDVVGSRMCRHTVHLLCSQGKTSHYRSNNTQQNPPKGPSIIVNFKQCTKHTLLGGGGEWVNGKKLSRYSFNILAHFWSFSWQSIKLKNVDAYTFSGGEGLRKYVLYTHLNVDNYGLPLNVNLFFYWCDKLGVGWDINIEYKSNKYWV